MADLVKVGMERLEREIMLRAVSQSIRHDYPPLLIVGEEQAKKDAAEREEDVPPDYFEFLRNPSDETSNQMKKDQDTEIARFGQMKKDQDTEIARFGLPLLQEGTRILNAVFKERMLAAEEEALVGWNEASIDLGITYSILKGKEMALIKWDHPVVAHLGAMSKERHSRNEDCIDLIMAPAGETRTCLAKIKEKLRERDS